MSLRFKTLISNFAPLYRKALFFILISFWTFQTLAQTSPEEVKKEAAKRFDEEDYTMSYKLYAQLVANYPKDPEYNYKLGVSMIFAEGDKKKCLPYLQFANSRPESPKETKFYLGKAYHINYLFDEALKFYNEFKKTASSSQQKKLQVDREIKACVYGKRLLSNLSDLVIQSKKQLNEADYFRSYDLRDIGGKLLVKPEEFKTSADKKKKDKSVVYLPKNGDRVYFSSYGESDNRDIYVATKLPNGTFSKPQKVGGINSEFDEDFPFLHPNGQTLYFASKGHNGMGGYDIFKSSYIESTNSWSQPVNMEFPINSPDDDYLYVTDSLEKTAFFSTGRQSLPGKIDVLKISTERKPIDILAIKGTVVKESADQSLKSKITVKNMDNGAIVGIFDAVDNGDYLMELPNGAKLLYTVETPGLKTQSDRVALPMVSTSKPLRQTISYDKGILKIINYFEETATDDSYLQYLKIIEKKAKLDVNEGQNKLGPTIIKEVAGDAKQPKGTGNTTNGDGPKVETEDAGTAVNTSSTQTEKLDNKKLSELARKDADEISKEANQLNNDSKDAYAVGTSKTQEAVKKLIEAEKEIEAANNIQDPDQKKEALAIALEKKAEAESDESLGKKLLQYADALKEDAAVKAKEAELNIKYAEELDKTTNPKNNNTESLAKLDFLQKQIDELSSRNKKSDAVYNSIKSEAEDKEKQLSALEKNHEANKNNVQEVKDAIASLEADLGKTKKKKDKEAIKEKIDELTADLVEKTTALSKTAEEIEKTKSELASVSKGIELAGKIKSEEIVPATTMSVTSNSTYTTPATEEKAVPLALNEKYKDKIAVTNENDPASISASTSELKNYNKEIDAALARNKTELGKTTSTAKKQQIAAENKALEEAKIQNQQQIATNTKKIQELSKANTNTNASVATASVNPNPVAKEINAVNASNQNDAISKLDALNGKLDNYDNSSFDFNGYQNPQAQAQKVDADAKINEAIAQQKKLKETVSSAKEKISKVNQASGSVSNADELHKQAEELSTKAFEIRAEAKSKTGTEKDQLIAKAKELEAQSNEKNLQAAGIVANDNKSVFETNNDNLNLLVNDKKASESDISEAKKLNEEAGVIFKQAASIREEANSIPNAGAKLGNLNNAEEKEAEAIAKQKEAVNLLKNSSPGLALKTATTSVTNTTAGDSGTDLGAELNTVNQGIESLLAKKEEAYLKLFEANNTEAKQLFENAAKNKQAIDKTPSLKSEYIAIENKLKAIEKAKSDAESETDKNKKIETLSLATKKQIELLNQLTAFEKNVASNASNASLSNNNSGNPENKTSETLASNTNTNTNSTSVSTESLTSNNNPEETNNNSTNSTKISSGTQTVNPESGDPGSSNSGTVASVSSATVNPLANTTGTSTSGTGSLSVSNTTVNNTNINNVTASNATVNTNAGNSNSASVSAGTISPTSTGDTTVSKVISLFENNEKSLTNPQAGSLVAKSIDELKKTESELSKIDQKLAGSTNNSGTSPAVLKSNAESLMMEADELSVKAFDLRTEAKTKQGTEKDELLNKAKELEAQSQAKKLNAIELNETANTKIYSTNSVAINELIEKAKKDDPSLASQLTEKINQVGTLKNQSSQLRNEAANLTNTNAKIGSYMNAEEKEAEMLQVQKEVLLTLKNKYPDYVVKEENAGDSQESNADLLLKKNLLKEKQYSSLTDLTNAFSLEYETSGKNVPANLNSQQEETKKKADELNAESKRMLIQSVNEKDEKEKTRLLTSAAKSGKQAVDLLKTIAPAAAINNTATIATANNNNNNGSGTNANANSNANTNKSTNNVNNSTGNASNGNSSDVNNPGNNTTANTNSTNAGSDNVVRNNTTANTNPGANNAVAANNAGTGTVKIEGLEVVRGNAYSETKPIPVDEKIPDGLVFRVQIGAFKNKIPNNSFRGLSPLNGETAGNGYIRYTAGNFQKFENANAVKNDLRNLGYSDAFVVVFFNGKRIPLNEALAILAKEGKKVDENAPQSAGITANTNVPRAVVNPANTNFNSQDAVAVTKELETINGLLFTVQIGVYNKQVSKQRLLNLRPVYTEKLPNGLYRYTAGIYTNTERLISDKNKVIGLGIRDAFVSAYLNGKRIPFAEGKERQTAPGTVMETENPIVFPDGNNTSGSVSVSNNTVQPSINTGIPGVQPFTNGVTSYPAATAENGVKNTEEGICFKVQIGAYSKQVPPDVAAKFSSIRTWPVENKVVNNLYIYNIGNFSGLQFARKLKEEAVRAGISDAFISVYKDGKKLSATEASQYVNPQ